MLKIAYSKAAIKALKRMPANASKRIRAKIAAYATDPKSQQANVKKLQGRDAYRLRVGDWRVIMDRRGNVLAVLAIGPRGSVYED